MSSAAHTSSPERPGATELDAAGSPGGVAVASTAAYAPSREELEADLGSHGWALGLRTTRSRLVASYLVLFLVAGAIATFALRELLVVRLDDQIDDDLKQEVSEVTELEHGRDPDTAEPFESIDRVFDVFFRRNEPGEDEALVALVGERVYGMNLTNFPVDSIPDKALDRWAAFSEGGNPGEQLTGQFDTAKGKARFQAVRLARGAESGAFVVTILPVTERAEIRELQFYAAVIAFAVVLLAAGAAWFLSGRVLAPVNELTETARSISESELRHRIRVRGTDEVANMARTFNAMLDRLEAVYQSQREFLRAAGHEFRTPLTVATGHLEVLGDGASEMDRNATVALVLDELRRMGRIVDDLQALAESERADFLAPQPFDLADLAEQLLTKARALGPRDWQLDEIAEASIVADRARITQAVLNLADNAVKNTEEGDTVAIGVGLRGGDVHFWVRDTGVGIPAADRERILERFERGSGAGSRYRGAGLGLAIVKTVAEAHGGRVELESREGHGARFTIVIPRR